MRVVLLLLFFTGELIATPPPLVSPSRSQLFAEGTSAARVATQETQVLLRIQAIIIDRELNQKPVPRLALTLRRDDQEGYSVDFRTSFDGIAEVQVPKGRYRLSTPQPTDFQGKQYLWTLDLTLSEATHTVGLSNDNATTSLLDERPVRAIDELSVLFDKLESSVVTVWSALGHGTGFVFDSSGLILTNQHVIGSSDYIAIQFDSQTKLPAKLLAADVEKDIAVVWVNLAGSPKTTVAPVTTTSATQPFVVEGERVFTIGSPLNQRKILTTGVISKVEPRALISDININSGNSGGPLFNSLGEVVGITTFIDPAIAGPGISGILRIDEALAAIADARTKMANQQPPEVSQLPVEPDTPFPVDAIKSALQTKKFDTDPYSFRLRVDYDVMLITPILNYYMREQTNIRAAQEKGKRTDEKESIKGSFQPLEDLKSWAEYLGEYKPVLLIRATPWLNPTWGSIFNPFGADNYRFKRDFYRMRLFCGGKEVAPIHPGKIAHVVDIRQARMAAIDATYEGFYTYSSDAISPACGKVVLEIYSENDPRKPLVKTLSTDTVKRVWADFEPYRTKTASTVLLDKAKK